MLSRYRFVAATAALIALSGFLAFKSSLAQSARFHDAPASASEMKNPMVGNKEAAEAGAKLYAADCAACHTPTGKGTGNIPSLAADAVQSAKDGEIFWFITNGKPESGMPAWGQLPEEQRWQIVTFLKSKDWAAATAAYDANTAASLKVSPPTPPFTDFRYEKPGTSRKITVADLPAPFTTESARNNAQVVDRPHDAWPKTLPGFKVDLYATNLNGPRLIRTAPNGDYFVAESDAGDVKVFRGISGDSKPQQTETFATGLSRPYGIAFYPPGANPQYVYIGDTDAVVRFPYQNGDLKARGKSEKIVDLPHAGGGHWTRSVQFSPDGKKMYVSVGSVSNIDDSDTHPDEKNRADVLEFNPDGSSMRIYAYGIRNSGGGLAVDPKTGTLWVSTNERDALGDNLVPDYITHIQDGGFYGWPWWYMGGHQDPRHMGKHPELKDKVITPDVPLQPHNASLQLTFYDGKQFPKEYDGDIFASEHGSWNKSVRVGYEVIRVPRHQSGKASGDYEDFLTGFVLDNGQVWGRPVGIAVASDGSLLVSDDGSNSIWRVSYAGK
jgi:glucose/arabinose dehydrogenase